MAMINTLPEELLILILMMLPLKSLLRFRCVSKSWYSLISCFDFIDSHIHRKQNLICGDYTHVLLKKILAFPATEIYTLHDDNQHFRELEECRLGFKDFGMVGCVNGLICLSKANVYTCINTMVLWNPFIRKCYLLPDLIEPPMINGGLQSTAKLRQSDICFGFGYDYLLKDFKVVRLIVHEIKTERLHGRHYKRDTYFSVFSLRTKSWSPPMICLPLHPHNRCFNLGRFVHRLAIIPDRKGGLEVASFDLSAKVFIETALPKFDKPLQGLKVELIVIRESLGIIHELDRTKFDIWSMKEDVSAKSWMKLYSVQLDGAEIGNRIIGFTKELMVVFGECNVSISPPMKDIRVLNYVPPSPRNLYPKVWHVQPLKSSLALLNEGASICFGDD